MKCILFSAAALFQIACNANYVTLMQPEQSWNPIVSASAVKIAQQSNNSAHAVYIPSQIVFVTDHNHFRHHTSTPTYNLDRLNTDQLACYFAAHNYTEGEILSHPMLYMNQAYLAIAKQLSRYPEFVEKYYKKYRTYKGFHKFWETIHFRYRKGMRKQFARLHQECEEQRLAKEAQARRNREEHEQKATAAYCAKLNQHVDDNMILDVVPYHHQQARNRAHEQIKTTALDRITRQHSVSSDVVVFAHEYELTEHDLTSLHGNAYEHQLHAELLEQLTKARTISNYYALQSKNILIDAIGHGVAIGMEANRLQQPDTATAWANFGWKMLDIIEGIGEGVMLFAENTADMILHPIHTLEQTVYGLGMLTGLVARTCAHAIGTASYWHGLMEHGDGLLMAQEMDHVAHKISALRSYCLEKAASLEARDIVKYGTVIAADMLLTHKMFVFGGMLCTRATPIIRDTIAHVSSRITVAGKIIANAIEAARTESPIVQTAEGIFMKAFEGLNKAGGAAMEVLKSSRLALETMHAQYMAHLEMELGALRLLFDNKVKGFAEFANKFIKIEYKHILGIDLEFSRRGVAQITGFHHDFLQTIEKGDLIKFANKIVHENGCYKADLIYAGETTKRGATFFPSEWSREKVIDNSPYAKTTNLI